MNYINTLAKRPIIGVKGFKNSGKDTVASMISYILKAGPTLANFDDWKKCNILLDDAIIHFADKIKDDLSTIFGIHRELFDNRDYKENKYYHFRTGYFITPNVLNAHPCPEITIEDLKENTLSAWLDSYGNDCVIKLRALMQYYGTEVIRNQIGRDTWIRVTMHKAHELTSIEGYAVIADVRFSNETNAIYDAGGDVVAIVREDVEIDSSHESEQIKVDSRDYIIDNNGTLLGLFYKVLEFVKNSIL